MTAPRPGDAFHLDLDGTVIAGRYIEVDPPHRLVIGWDRQGTDTATPAPAFIEITFTPAGDGTNVEVLGSAAAQSTACSNLRPARRHRHHAHAKDDPGSRRLICCVAEFSCLHGCAADVRDARLLSPFGITRPSDRRPNTASFH